MFRLVHSLSTSLFDEGNQSIPATRRLAGLPAELLCLCSGRSDEHEDDTADHTENGDGEKTSSLVNLSNSLYIA